MEGRKEVAQSCLTLCDPMDYTVHGILHARILEPVAFPFSRESSQPRDWTQVFHIADRFFTNWSTSVFIGSRKTSEADPHWSILSHKSEPITVARARFNTLILPGKGFPSSSRISLTKGGTGWFQRKIWILLWKEVERNAQKVYATEVHQRRWQPEIWWEESSLAKSGMGRNIPAGVVGKIDA